MFFTLKLGVKKRAGKTNTCNKPIDVGNAFGVKHLI